MHTAPSPSENNSQVDAALFDFRLAFLWAGFVLRSVRRHRLLALASFFALAAMVGGLVLVVPPKYHVETVLLVNRSSMLASLGNPNRNLSVDLDGPLLAARETVMAYKNLEGLVLQLGLIPHWKEVRNPLLQLKDRLKESLSKPLTEEERLREMVYILEKRLVVYTGPNWTVNVEVYWPDAAMAFRIAQAAQQNFLETRRVAEVSAVSEAIAILESHVSNSETCVAQSVEEMEKAVKEFQASRKESASLPAPLAGKTSLKPSEAANTQMLAQLHRAIRTRIKALEEAEERHEKKLAELQNQLREQSTVYTPSHPNIRALERHIQAAREASTQTALKNEIESLTAEYRRAGGKALDADFLSRHAPTAASHDSFLALSEMDEAPAVLVAREKLRMAVATLQEFQMRLHSAHIELEAAKAAFESRYNIVKPAHVPRRPLFPNRLLIAGVGLVASALFGLFSCFFFELFSGRLLQAWQAEQRATLPAPSEGAS